MRNHLTDDEIRSLRLRFQRLTPRRAASSVKKVVADVCGLQAQDSGATDLAVRARSNDLTAKDITVARYEDRSVVRTWCIRGTLHLVAADDLPWLLSLFGPAFVGRSKRRLADLGFDDVACERAMQAIHNALSDHEPLTRIELANYLQSVGIECGPETQAPYHLVRRAALLGILCEVAPKDGEEAYGLLENWVAIDEPPSRDDALAELARRYLTAYQPASLADFAAWSRLPMRDVREGWELIDETTTSIATDGEPARILTDSDADSATSDSDVVRLLPAYDTYLIGYESREHVVSAEYERRVRPGGGVIRPTVILDGRAMGTWKLDRSRKVNSVVISPFDAFDSELTSRLTSEIDDLSRFLGANIEYRVEGS